MNSVELNRFLTLHDVWLLIFTTLSITHRSLSFFFNFFLQRFHFFLERGEERERNKMCTRYISRLPLHRPALNLLSHTCQGSSFPLFNYTRAVVASASVFSPQRLCLYLISTGTFEYLSSPLDQRV